MMLEYDRTVSERGQFRSWLFTMPWCDAATRAHDGYAHDAFHSLLDAKRPPAVGGWRELVWRVWQCFTKLQRARGTVNTS